MSRGHRGGAASGDPKQGAGTHRGPETGNGYTASTGRGKPSGVEFRGTAPDNAGKRSVLRTIGDILGGKHRK